MGQARRARLRAARAHPPPGALAGSGGTPDRDALTTTVDLHATLCDLFRAPLPGTAHGRSLVPLLTRAATSVREWALTGVWGREVHLIEADGTKYARGPVGDNAPLSMWSNRWSTMPVHSMPDLRLPDPDDRATLDRMPGSDIPVIRQPFAAGDPLPYWALTRFTGNHLWQVDDDPGEERDLAGTPAEKAAADALADALWSIEAPDDQLVRLGLD